MKRFVEGTDRQQSTLFPAVLDEYVDEDNPVRAIDVFVDGLRRRCRPCSGSAGRPSGDAVEDLHLRVFQSRAVEPTA